MAREFLINSDDFRCLYGQFMVTWNVLDLTTDLAICKFLGVTSEQAHLITSGMMYGNKARLLRDLASRSKSPRKDKIVEALNKITRGQREAIVHSYVRGDGSDVVIFVERKKGGEYDVKEHRFTLESWSKHVNDFHEDCVAFHKALGVTESEIEEFGDAAVSASRKARKSPGKPDSTE